MPDADELAATRRCDGPCFISFLCTTRGARLDASSSLRHSAPLLYVALMCSARNAYSAFTPRLVQDFALRAGSTITAALTSCRVFRCTHGSPDDRLGCLIRECKIISCVCEAQKSSFVGKIFILILFFKKENMVFVFKSCSKVV